MSRPARWLVLGGELSPYVPELWASVEALGDEVLLLSEPRAVAASFDHEAGVKAPAGLRWLLPSGPRARFGAMLAALRFRPDVVVGLGYTRPWALLALLAFRILRPRARRILVGDANGLQWLADGGRAFSGLRAALKRAMVRVLFQGAFHLGWTNELAFRFLGLETLAFLPVYAVDFDALERARSLAAVDARLGALDRPLVLCLSRLVAVKNLPALVTAWRAHCEAGGRGGLAIVGEGPERERVEAAAAGLPASRLTILGAVARGDVGGLLRQADGLVLPSRREPWGIVVVEALGLGVPVLATRWVGAAVSLQEAASSAVRTCDGSVEALQASLAALVADLEPMRAAAARCAPAIREAYGLHQVAARLSAWGRTAAAQRGRA